MQPPCAKRRRIDFVDEPVRNGTIYSEMACNNVFYNDSWGYEMDEAAVEEMPVQWSELSSPPKYQRTKCIMCGSSGHLASTCPSACCLKCGEKTDFFEDECGKCVVEASTVCEICGYRGHMKNNCPNYWKCYHSTIDMASAPQYSTLESLRYFQFNLNGGEQPGGFYERSLYR